MNFTATGVFTPAPLSVVMGILGTQLQKGAEDAVALVYKKADALVPVDTGELRGSASNEVVDSGSVVTGTVAYESDHAAFVEFGTGIRGAASPGAGPYSYDPTWPGMDAQPFLRPALDESDEDVLDAIVGALR